MAGFLICAGQVRRCVGFLVRGDDGKDLGHRLAIGFGDDPPVIGGLAAGEGHVRALTGRGAVHDGVRGIDGNALGAVDGGRVSELHVLFDVARRQGQRVSAGRVDLQGAVLVNVGDGEQIAVGDE